MCLTQRQIIVKKLTESNSVTRNWCLKKHFITRLSARILDLKNDGWIFKTEDVKIGNGKDYKYTVVKRGLE